MVKDPITYKPQIQAREGGKMVTDLLRRLQANTCPEAWSHLGQPKAILIHEATCPTQPQATTLDRLRSIHAYHLWGGSAKLECEIVNNREDQNAQLDDGNTQRISVHCPGPPSAMGKAGVKLHTRPDLGHPPPPPIYPIHPSMQLLCKVMYG